MTRKNSPPAGSGGNVTPSRDGGGTRLAIEYRPIAALVPYARNARTHSDAQVAEIAGSIQRFGFINPILVDERGLLIAGHGRLLAARKVGLAEVPVIELHGLSDAQRRALALADNRIALNSGWDADLLRSELDALRQSGEDLAGLGFDPGELDDMFSPSTGISASEVATGAVDDRFWISIRGPLADQAEVLQRLMAAMGDLPSVEVELGTVAVG